MVSTHPGSISIAEVDVRIRRVRAAGAAAIERDPLHALDRREPIGDHLQLHASDHSTGERSSSQVIRSNP